MKQKIKKINSVKFYYTDPRNILDDINSIPELYYLANLTMASNYRVKINPEVPLLIGYDAYSKLLTYFGGTNMYIPTRDELQSNLLGIMSYYYYNIRGLTWTETIKKLHMTPTKGSRRLLRNRWKAFKDIIESGDNKIPELGSGESGPVVEMHDPPVKCGDQYITKELFSKVIKTVCEDLTENAVLDEDTVSKILARYD